MFINKPLYSKITYAIGKSAKYPFSKELMEKLCKIADDNCHDHDEEGSVEDE